jgi:cardiolipin synthase
MLRDAGTSTMSRPWSSGNKFTLLENGEAFFPRVFEVIATEQREVLLETFILYEDKVGKALHAALLAAARHGVQIDVTVDGFGSAGLSGEFIGSLAAAGVRLHVFDPASRLLSRLFGRLNYFHRLHRKLVVDGVRAFIGDINYAAGDAGGSEKFAWPRGMGEGSHAVTANRAVYALEFIRVVAVL